MFENGGIFDSKMGVYQSPDYGGALWALTHSKEDQLKKMLGIQTSIDVLIKKFERTQAHEDKERLHEILDAIEELLLKEKDRKKRNILELWAQKIRRALANPFQRETPRPAESDPTLPPHPESHEDARDQEFFSAIRQLEAQYGEDGIRFPEISFFEKSPNDQRFLAMFQRALVIMLREPTVNPMAGSNTGYPQLKSEINYLDYKTFNIQTGDRERDVLSLNEFISRCMPDRFKPFFVEKESKGLLNSRILGLQRMANAFYRISEAMVMRENESFVGPCNRVQAEYGSISPRTQTKNWYFETWIAQAFISNWKRVPVWNDEVNTIKDVLGEHDDYLVGPISDFMYRKLQDVADVGIRNAAGDPPSYKDDNYLFTALRANSQEWVFARAEWKKEAIERLKKDRFCIDHNLFIQDGGELVPTRYLLDQIDFAQEMAIWKYRTSLLESKAEPLSNNGATISRVLNRIYVWAKARGGVKYPERACPTVWRETGEFPSFEEYLKHEVVIPRDQMDEVPYNSWPEDVRTRVVSWFAEHPEAAKDSVKVIRIKETKGVEDSLRDPNRVIVLVPIEVPNDDGTGSLKYWDEISIDGVAYRKFQVSAKDRAMAAIPYEYVRFNSSTTSPTENYGELLKFWLQIHYSGKGNLLDDAKFTNLHAEQYKEKVHIKNSWVFGLFGEKMQELYYRSRLFSAKMAQNSSLALSKIAREILYCDHFLPDDLGLKSDSDPKDEAGFGWSMIFKDPGRYFWNVIKNSAANRGVFDQATKTFQNSRDTVYKNVNLILDMFRGFGEGTALSPELLGVVVDYIKGKTTRAENTFLLHQLMYFVKLLLDRYQISSKITGEGNLYSPENLGGLPFNIATMQRNLELFVEEVRTRSYSRERKGGRPPLTSIQIEAFLSALNAMLKYAADIWKKNLPARLIQAEDGTWCYESPEYMDSILASRGIIGTPESEAVDLAAIFPFLKTGQKHKEEKKH